MLDQMVQNLENDEICTERRILYIFKMVTFNN